MEDTLRTRLKKLRKNEYARERDSHKVNDRIYEGVTNIGYSPTLKTTRIKEIETYILDFDEDLYGKTIEVIFRQKLREELKFDGLEALKKQMSVDVQQVRELFNERVS